MTDYNNLFFCVSELMRCERQFLEGLGISNYPGQIGFWCVVLGMITLSGLPTLRRLFTWVSDRNNRRLFRQNFSAQQLTVVRSLDNSLRVISLGLTLALFFCYSLRAGCNFWFVPSPLFSVLRLFSCLLLVRGLVLCFWVGFAGLSHFSLLFGSEHRRFILTRLTVVLLVFLIFFKSWRLLSLADRQPLDEVLDVVLLLGFSCTFFLGWGPLSSGGPALSMLSLISKTTVTKTCLPLSSYLGSPTLHRDLLFGEILEKPHDSISLKRSFLLTIIIIAIPAK